MKSTRRTVIALVFLPIIAAVGYWLLSSNSDKRQGDIKAVYDYLKQAESIKIIQMNYNETSRQVKTNVFVDSNDKVDISSFLDVLIQCMEQAKVQTSFKAMEVFTPDYRVELKCDKTARIDFIFHGNTNAACLRNEDCFFFAEFDVETAKILKNYLKKSQ